jgi:hypothetical protein
MRRVYDIVTEPLYTQASLGVFVGGVPALKHKIPPPDLIQEVAPESHVCPLQMINLEGIGPYCVEVGCGASYHSDVTHDWVTGPLPLIHVSLENTPAHRTDPGPVAFENSLKPSRLSITVVIRCRDDIGLRTLKRQISQSGL